MDPVHADRTNRFQNLLPQPCLKWPFKLQDIKWKYRKNSNNYGKYMSQTRTSVEAMMLSCKYSDALCWSSASALRKLLCCLNTSWIWGLISGNKFTNFIYVDSRSALVMGEHKWYCKRTHILTCSLHCFQNIFSVIYTENSILHSECTTWDTYPILVKIKSNK